MSQAPLRKSFVTAGAFWRHHDHFRAPAGEAFKDFRAPLKAAVVQATPTGVGTGVGAVLGRPAPRAAAPTRRYANGSPQEGRPCAQRGPFVIPSPNGREKASPRELPPSPSRSGSSWAQMPRTDPGISLPSHGLGLGLPSTARGRTLLGGQGRGRFVSWKDSVKPQTSFFWQSARRLIDERVSCARAAKIFHDVSGARQCLGFAWQAWHRGEAAWGCVEFQQESVPLLDLTGSFIKG